MVQRHEIDGRLAPWAEVQARREWSTLLVGNGLSINVWPAFSYASLHARARGERAAGGLSDEDAQLFEALDGTTNFERVLAELRSAIRVARACGQDTTPFAQRYRRVQQALAVAVRAAHLERALIPGQSLHEIRAALLGYRQVFTTNYDLLLYWAMGHGETFAGFCDCFWSNGRNEFDRSRTTIWDDLTPVFYLHGALHLVVQGSGATRKLTYRNTMILKQVGRPVPGDPSAETLLVTEGSSDDKLRAIESNEYLRFALESLRQTSSSIVVFGHSLGPQDEHLLDAINLHPQRPVAVSLLPDRAERVRARQAEIRSTLATEQLYFFDSRTHPLGARHLRAPAPPSLTPATAAADSTCDLSRAA